MVRLRAVPFFGTSDHPGGKLLLDWARFRFFDRLHLWFHHHKPATAPGSSAEEFIIAELRAVGVSVSEDEFIATRPIGPIPVTNIVAKIFPVPALRS